MLIHLLIQSLRTLKIIKNDVYLAIFFDYIRVYLCFEICTKNQYHKLFLCKLFMTINLLRWVNFTQNYQKIYFFTWKSQKNISFFKKCHLKLFWSVKNSLHMLFCVLITNLKVKFKWDTDNTSKYMIWASVQTL